LDVLSVGPAAAVSYAAAGVSNRSRLIQPPGICRVPMLRLALSAERRGAVGIVRCCLL
jgi:hypothetical protein